MLSLSAVAISGTFGGGAFTMAQAIFTRSSGEPAAASPPPPGTPVSEIEPEPVVKTPATSEVEEPVEPPKKVVAEEPAIRTELPVTKKAEITFGTTEPSTTSVEAPRDARVEALMARAEEMMLALARLTSALSETSSGTSVFERTGATEGSLAIFRLSVISVGGDWSTVEGPFGSLKALMGTASGEPAAVEEPTAEPEPVSEEDPGKVSPVRDGPPEGFAGKFLELTAETVASMVGSNYADAIAISAGRVGGFNGLKGDDTIAIAGESIGDVRGGRGRDAVSVTGIEVGTVSGGRGADTVTVSGESVAKVTGGRGDDTVDVAGGAIQRVAGGRGDDTVTVTAEEVIGLDAGRGDDKVTVTAGFGGTVDGGAGDDELTISGGRIEEVLGGDGDDTLTLTAEEFDVIDGGAGNDTVTISAEDAAIRFGAGGGEDEVTIAGVGTLAIQITPDLAADADEMTVTRDGNSIVLSFASGEKLTLNDVERASMITAKIGSEMIELTGAELPEPLEAVA